MIKDNERAGPRQVDGSRPGRAAVRFLQLAAVAVSVVAAAPIEASAETLAGGAFRQTAESARSLLDRVDLGDDFIVVNDREAVFDTVYGELLPTDFLVEHRAFAGGWLRQYISVSRPLSIRLEIADLTTQACARSVVEEPAAYRLGGGAGHLGCASADRREPIARVRTNAAGQGEVTVEALTAHGRLVGYITITGTRSEANAWRGLAADIVDELEGAPAPPDLARSQTEHPNLGNIATGTLSQFWTWYLVGAAILAARDRALWQRMRALVMRRHRTPPSVGLSVISVARTARLLRLRSMVFTLWWWVSRPLALYLLVVVVVTLLIAAPQVGVVVTVIGGMLIAAWRQIPRRRDTFSEQRYRQMLASVGIGFRLVLGVSVFAVGLILTVSMPAAGLLRSFIESLDLPEGADFSSGVEVGSGVVVLAIAFLVLPWRQTRRIAREGFAKIVQDDGRRPIPLLRSFDDDRRKIRVRRGRRHGFIDRVSLTRFDPFEETVVWSFWRHGPVVAAQAPPGRRGRRRPSLGAARQLLGEDWWKSVSHLIEQAPLVVVIVGTRRPPGETDWLAWEISRVDAVNALSRTVFVLPPVSDGEADERLRYLSEILRIPLAAIAQRSGRGDVVLAVTVDEGRTPTFITGQYRDDISYDLALAQALEQLTPAAPRPATPSGSPWVPPAAGSLSSPAGRVARFLASTVPTFALLLVAWVFMFFSIAQVREFSAYRAGTRAPYHLPGIGAVAPSGGVAASGSTVVSYDLTGDVQILHMDNAGRDERFDVGDPPTAAAVDGDLVALAHRSTNRITILRSADVDSRRTVDVPGPIDVAIDSGSVVAVAPDGTASVIGPTSGAVRTFPIGGTPLAVATLSDRAFVVDAGSDEVAEIDIARGAVVRRFSTCRGPRDILVAERDTLTVVCELDGTLTRHDPDGTIVSSQNVGVGPFALSAAPGGFVVADRGVPFVFLIDGDRQLRLPAGTGASGIAVSDQLLLLSTPSDERIGIYDLTEPLPSPTPWAL